MSTETTSGGNGNGNGNGEFMLFGVRVVVDSMRKSVSLNNLSQYQHRLDVDMSTETDVVAGYVSADDPVRHLSSNTTTATTAGSRDRKRGVPWTEEEHKLFLQGLQKVGKGDWRGISRIYVKTRTPTQVASHAQKYFLRRSNLNRRRRRSSLFDITTDSVAASSSNDQMSNETPIERAENKPHQGNFEVSDVKLTISPSPIHSPLPAQVVLSPASSSKSMMDFNLNTTTSTNTNTNTSDMSFDQSPLSLNLSLSMSTEVSNATLPGNNSVFQGMQCFRNPDGMISVA